jgi:hypothetical protein
VETAVIDDCINLNAANQAGVDKRFVRYIERRTMGFDGEHQLPVNVEPPEEVISVGSKELIP